MQNSNTQLIEILAATCFGLAILHTFAVSFFQKLANRFPEGSVLENLFHLMGEVEVVFGIWAAIYVLGLVFVFNADQAIGFLESNQYTEPLFVFVVMVISSTRPVLITAEKGIDFISGLIPIHKSISYLFSILVFGSLMGSLITEPAAMTVSANLLLIKFFDKPISHRLAYGILATLFVNISISGTLTNFAAPPVLMVAKPWALTTPYMFTHFGWKAILASSLSTLFLISICFKELKKFKIAEKSNLGTEIPAWVSILHLFFLVIVVRMAHHPVVFLGVFLFFLGLVTVTREFQTELKLREGLLVAFFLGGLVILGQPQKFWIEPLITRLDSLALFLGTTALTAITDNAALTYLGSQVPNLSETSKYALLSGAVVGGGLTVIANAPNPVGYGILNQKFGKSGINPILLFTYALPATLIAAICFWFL